MVNMDDSIRIVYDPIDIENCKAPKLGYNGTIVHNSI